MTLKKLQLHLSRRDRICQSPLVEWDTKLMWLLNRSLVWFQGTTGHGGPSDKELRLSEKDRMGRKDCFLKIGEACIRLTILVGMEASAQGCRLTHITNARNKETEISNQVTLMADKMRLPGPACIFCQKSIEDVVGSQQVAKTIEQAFQRRDPGSTNHVDFVA
jgi:hypothetical protein